MSRTSVENNLFPVLLDSAFIGRQNGLIAIAEALEPSARLVLTDELVNHTCSAEFAVAAQECTKSSLEFQHILDAAEKVMHESFMRIPHDVRPIFLSYEANISNILAGVLLKRERPETILVSITRPIVAADYFDLVVRTPAEQPYQDLMRVIDIQTIPTRITDALLVREREKWGPVLLRSGKPLIAVIVGGSVPIAGQPNGHDAKAHFTVEHAEELSDQVLKLSRSLNFDFVFTNSFRTPAEITSVLINRLGPHAVHFYNYQIGGDNPYFGYAACSRSGIVTADSMSMTSDAIDAGLETAVFLPFGMLQTTHNRFLNSLINQKLVKSLDEGLNLRPSKPVRAAQKIADKIFCITACG